jgi:AcrR family transcriptional regulator
MSIWIVFGFFDLAKHSIGKQKRAMMEANMRRREIGLERRERTRQKLLEAAARVVAELGEKRATVDDFIQAAGIARGTFYNYYPTQGDLLDDLWSRVGRNPFQAIQDACRALADPAERLAAVARLVLDCAERNVTWGWLVYALSADTEAVNDDLLAYPRPDLEAGRQQGRFQFADLGSANDMVVATVRKALRATLSDERTSNYSANICVLLLKALGLSDREARNIAARPLPSLVMARLELQ